MNPESAIARALAGAFVAGSLDAEGLIERGAALLGRRWRWLVPLAQRISLTYAGRPRPRKIQITEFLLADDLFARACSKHNLRIANWLASPSSMSSLAAAVSWRVPALADCGELAQWLGITLGELDWFADRRNLEAKRSEGPLRHYHYRTLAKKFGSVRLVEAPKPRLKTIQRRILLEILDKVPSHDAAHGFRRGRSIKTFATPHVGRRVVLRLDLQDFFPSISLARVQALFRALGYPESVADVLAALSTNAAPDEIWGGVDFGSAAGTLRRSARRRYAEPHLPQGAPTSPAIANLCAYRLDCRLAGLATAAGATYTRYADDLAFSGDRRFERVVGRFQAHVAARAMEEGFSVHHRKTRIMREGVRQRLAGVVVNQRLNSSRTNFDCLKAILANCIRHGAKSQNRAGHENFRAHLLGRISFVAMLNEQRGERLRALFDQIAW